MIRSTTDSLNVTINGGLAGVVAGAVRSAACASADRFERHAIQERQAREVLAGYPGAGLLPLLDERLESRPPQPAEGDFASLDRAVWRIMKTPDPGHCRPAASLAGRDRPAPPARAAIVGNGMEGRAQGGVGAAR